MFNKKLLIIIVNGQKTENKIYSCFYSYICLIIIDWSFCFWKCTCGTGRKNYTFTSWQFCKL